MTVPDGVNARAQGLLQRLAACDLCPRRCGANRQAGERGYCRTAADVEIAHIGLHHGEEPPISGSRGSGTIFFAHCNLRCVFCQNYQISQCAEQIDTWLANPEELARVYLEVAGRGAHNINLVSPSHVAAQAAAALCIAREQGLAIPVVYNSNGYDALDTLQALDGLIDIYLPDIKYSDNAMAKRYSGVDDYVEVSRPAIAEMFRQVGELQVDDDGVAQRGLLVRHLIMPADVSGSRASLDFLASLSQNIYISLMSQYSPQHQAHLSPPINRRLTHAEYDGVLEYALDLGLENCFIQQLESSDVFVPDFTQERPFAG